MNDDFITEISVETGTDTDISVSGNDVETPTESVPQDETETETADEEIVETVSGNDVLATASDTGTSSVSGNNVYIPYDDSGLIAQIGVMNTEIAVLNSNMQEMHTTLLGVSAVLTMFFGFTVFKWCEQKIKRFTKGVFNKYE